MRSSKAFRGVASVLACAAMHGCATSNERERVVDSSDVPAPAMLALQNAAAGGTLVRVTQRIEPGGVVVYAGEIHEGSDCWDVAVSPEGTPASRRRVGPSDHAPMK